MLYCNEKDVIDTFNLITEYSAYAYEQNMAEGFITIPGGHRVGIGGYMAGTIYDKPIVRNIRFINFRINHHIKNCSEMIFPKLYKNNHLCNTLIISPPGLGKTTLLRDLVIKLVKILLVQVYVSLMSEMKSVVVIKACQQWI